jgi:hypothetical protein
MLPFSLPNRSAPVSLLRLFGVVHLLTVLAVSTPSLHTKEPSNEWQSQDFQEFVPQTFDGQMVGHYRFFCHMLIALDWY